MESLAREARAMPNHPESERSVLGAMLRSNEAALLVLESLTEDDFYDPANREVYSAMRALSETGRALDLVTLDAELSSCCSNFCNLCGGLWHLLGHLPYAVG